MARLDPTDPLTRAMVLCELLWEYECLWVDWMPSHEGDCIETQSWWQDWHRDQTELDALEMERPGLTSKAMEALRQLTLD